MKVELLIFSMLLLGTLHFNGVSSASYIDAQQQSDSEVKKSYYFPFTKINLLLIVLSNEVMLNNVADSGSGFSSSPFFTLLRRRKSTDLLTQQTKFRTD